MRRTVASRVRGASRKLRRSFPVRVRAGAGAGLRLDLRWASADYALGTNELPVQRVFTEQLRRGDVVYDVGSNVGFYCLIAARLVGPGGWVHAFEPVPECSAAVVANARRNRLANVTVHPVAVAASEGTVELLRSRHPGGATVSAADRPHDFTEAMSVPSVTLDGLVARDVLAPPDFVKIDVEGAEDQVLTGMQTVLDTARPVVLCEVDDSVASEAEGKAARVSTLLEAHGYRTHRLDPSYPGARSIVLHVLGLPDDRT